MGNTKHGLQQTKGFYQLRGIVNGIDKEKFYQEKKTKNNKPMRLINFGVEVEPNKSIYLNLNGFVKDKVYFCKRDKESNKTITEEIPWSQKDTFNKDGFNLIGVRLGLEKDKEGRNIKKTLTEFDACREISKKIQDNVSIFTKGNIEFSSFIDNNQNNRRFVKFVPQQISLCKDVDFANENYEVKSDFSQQIVFMGIEPQDDVFVVKAKIITYSTIEDTEFIVKDKKLANIFRKRVEPYNAIQVHGHIEVIENVSTVEEDDDDVWGEEDPTQRVDSPTRRVLVISGAKGKTLDTTTYTKEKIDEAIQKLTQSENAKEDWGASDSIEDADDEEW